MVIILLVAAERQLALPMRRDTVQSKIRGELPSMAQSQGSPASGPQSSFPKQAIVVIHGMGEQQPMDTIDGFVAGVWDDSIATQDPGIPGRGQVWSKPDLRTGSLELRRITTRQSIASETFATGLRSDFYELYWADLSGGSTWDQVKAWILGLLFRNPLTGQVPKDVFCAWVLLWVLTLAVLFFAAATAIPRDASIFGFAPWDHGPLLWVATWPKALLGAIAAFIAWVEHQFVVPYFGRVVRYTRATPENIAARKNIRERGLKLLNELHQAKYARIVVVGHSLGSILAYDLISYFWAEQDKARIVKEQSAEFAALQNLERAAAALDAEKSFDQRLQAAFIAAQRDFAETLRKRAAPEAPWLITDLVTVGSPLTHAEFLLAHDKDDLEAHVQRRELPRCPPLRESLDPGNRDKAKRPFGNARHLMSFPIDGTDQWQLHHAAPFAAVRWTNLHDPAFAVWFGDQISGPVGPLFGRGVLDIDLRAMRRRQSWYFSHTRYWSRKSPGDRANLARLREVLDLSYQNKNPIASP
jgi:hypothetical protein